ncbi:MAG: glycerophosphodiester phosphodiesterase [Streptosporangiaceae bacterium]
MAERLFEPRPVVMGHRGFGRHSENGYAENTVASVVAAVEHGLSWIEFDVRRSRDDQLVVHHNPTTTDGAFVIEQTADEVTARGIPRLTELLDALPPEVGVNVDVKTELEDAVTEPDGRTGGLLAAVLAKETARRRVLATSFDPALLLDLRERAPDMPLGLITWADFPLRHAVPAAVHLGMRMVSLHHGSFGPNRIERGPVHRPPAYSVDIAHRAGIEVLAWCPDVPSAVELARSGVDALCVNDVPGVLDVLRGTPWRDAPHAAPGRRAPSRGSPDGAG